MVMIAGYTELHCRYPIVVWEQALATACPMSCVRPTESERSHRPDLYLRERKKWRKLIELGSRVRAEPELAISVFVHRCWILERKTNVARENHGRVFPNLVLCSTAHVGWQRVLHPRTGYWYPVRRFHNVNGIRREQASLIPIAAVSGGSWHRPSSSGRRRKSQTLDGS